MSKSTKQIKRAPIVSILGHVDHGKTSILDRIRAANVVDKEAGGITQKISVFTLPAEAVNTQYNITFIDTPGHEAFDLMRTRGGTVADIVLLVVAADDGLMPQTKESIEIIKNSAAKPIVVMNKIDLPNVDKEKIKRELATEGLQVEEYGGDIPLVEVSAKTGEGFEKLLETIDLLVEVEGFIEREELPVGVKGKAFVLESNKETSRGNVSAVVVTQGEFARGDFFTFAKDDPSDIEKVKGVISEDGDNLTDLQSGYGAKIIGISELVPLGGEIFALESKDKKIVKELFAQLQISENAEDANPEIADSVSENWLTEMFSASADDETDESGELNLIVKAGSEGSLEALLSSLDRLDVDGYKVKIVQSGVGDINVKDIQMADITKSIIVAFESQIESSAKSEAERSKVIVRTYDIIYKLTEEIEDALTILSTPEEAEEDLGSAEIRQVFVLSNGDKVLGGRVIDGVIKRGAKCYIVRNDDIVAEGKISSLKNNKDEIKEATKGAEFGAIISSTIEDVQEGDEIHCFKMVKII